MIASNAACPWCAGANIAGALLCDTCGGLLRPVSVVRDRSRPAAPSQSKPAVVSPAAPATTLPVAYFVAESGYRAEAPLQDVAIVGRADARTGIKPDVDLSLVDASSLGVSRRHCRLLRTVSGWFIEDLRSTNATVLNGQTLDPYILTPIHDGDEVRLGRLRLRFEIEHAASST